MRWAFALPLLAACGNRSSGGPAPDVGVEANPDMAPAPEPDLGPDAPPPVSCQECVQECLVAQCPTQYGVCLANQCAGPDGGIADAGATDAGPDASIPPPNCAEIVACLILSQCNPLKGNGDPCFDACYGPACAGAKAAFDNVLDCAVDMCVDDCFGCV